MTRQAIIVCALLHVVTVCMAQVAGALPEPSLVLRIDAHPSLAKAASAMDYPMHLIVRGDTAFLAKTPKTVPPKKEIKKYRLDIVRPMMSSSSGYPEPEAKGHFLLQWEVPGINEDVMCYEFRIPFTVAKAKERTIRIGEEAFYGWKWRFPKRGNLATVKDFSPVAAATPFRITVLKNEMRLPE